MTMQKQQKTQKYKEKISKFKKQLDRKLKNCFSLFY